MPVSTDNNFPVQATGKLSENAAGNTSVPTPGHSQDQDTGVLNRATGNLPENAAGSSPDRDSGLLVRATGNQSENTAGLCDEAAGLSEGTTSDSRNLDQVICVNHFFIFSL
jgi:hypothetical protein